MARMPPLLLTPAHSRGVTVVELCAGVAILAIGGALALPAFQQTLARTRAQSAVHLLSAQLASARSTAVSRRVPVSVCPSDDGQRCSNGNRWDTGWIMYLDPARQDQPASSQDVLRAENALARKLTITTSAGRRLVRYQPNGRSSGTNLTFRICDRDRLMATVIINNVGRTRSEHIRGRDEAC